MIDCRGLNPGYIEGVMHLNDVKNIRSAIRRPPSVLQYAVLVRQPGT